MWAKMPEETCSAEHRSPHRVSFQQCFSASPPCSVCIAHPHSRAAASCDSGCHAALSPWWASLHLHKAVQEANSSARHDARQQRRCFTLCLEQQQEPFVLVVQMGRLLLSCMFCSSCCCISGFVIRLGRAAGRGDLLHSFSVVLCTTSHIAWRLKLTAWTCFAKITCKLPCQPVCGRGRARDSGLARCPVCLINFTFCNLISW